MESPPSKNTPYSICLISDFVQSCYKVDHVKRSRVQLKNETKQDNCVHGFCEDVEDYPETLIGNLIHETQDSDSYFMVSKESDELNDMVSPMASSLQQNSICQTNPRTIFPQASNNTKGEWKHIVNVEKHYQGVEMEECSNEGDECPVHLFRGYTSSCEQKFAIVKLKVLDEKNRKLTWDVFRVPSCCVCVIKPY
ncbi:hypothetical protein HHI36_012333 [Cryptolaemus montrouzieri]|uniref:Spaetzle domain-containing protein n=1 Tax=Cryptolaemus montrouzieri TaxID=559131 RepID=A0ABD2NEN4_9CUCU